MKRGMKILALGISLVFAFTLAASAVQSPGTIYQGDGMHFYRIVTTDYRELTWEQARVAAAALPAYTPPGTTLTLTPHLVTINSQSEQNFLMTLPGAGTTLWIGLYQDAVGAEPDGGWKWVTAESLTYTNWNGGEPNDAGSVEDYGEWTSGGWNDNNNTGRANGYIVEYESIPPVAGVDLPGVDGVYINEVADMQLLQAQLNAGYSVNVTGYVGFLTGQNNPAAPVLTSLKLEVAKSGSGTWTQIDLISGLPQSSAPLSGHSGIPGSIFNSFDPWIVTSAGSYVIRVTAIFSTGETEVDTQVVTVTLLSDKPVKDDTASNPAAPAVAAAILKEAGIGHKYDTGEVGRNGKHVYGNYITDVSKKMGNGTSDANGSCFMGIDKSDTVNYYNAVYAYLVSLGAPLS